MFCYICLWISIIALSHQQLPLGWCCNWWWKKFFWMAIYYTLEKIPLAGTFWINKNDDVFEFSNPNNSLHLTGVCRMVWFSLTIFIHVSFTCSMLGALRAPDNWSHFPRLCHNNIFDPFWSFKHPVPRCLLQTCFLKMLIQPVGLSRSRLSALLYSWADSHTDLISSPELLVVKICFYLYTCGGKMCSAQWVSLFWCYSIAFVSSISDKGELMLTAHWLTQHAGKVRARACKTDLGSRGWGKATVHKHHPCSAPEEKAETSVLIKSLQS